MKTKEEIRIEYTEEKRKYIYKDFSSIMRKIIEETVLTQETEYFQAVTEGKM